MILRTMFTDVQTTGNDPNGNVTTDAILVAHYNRIQEECAHILMQMGAEIAMTDGTLTGDGSAQSYVLPSDFRALVPNTMMPRNPTTATSAYTHAAPLLHVDRLDRQVYGSASLVGIPSRFCHTVSGTNQYVKFDIIPTANTYYDYQYYPTCTRAIVGGTLDTNSTPWLGLLDPLFSRSLEEYVKDGFEFTTEKRTAWRARAEADIAMVIGLRHVKQQVPQASMWKRFPKVY